jgi:uncharacterized membrane protein
MYSILTLFMLLSVYYTVQTLQNRHTTRNYVYYTVFTICMLWTHVFAAFVVMAELVYVVSVILVDWTDDRWMRLKNWFIVELVAGVAFGAFLLIVFGPVLAAANGTRSNISWLTPPTIGDLRDVLLSIGGAPLQYPIVNFDPLIRTVSIGFLVLGALATIGGLVRFDGGRRIQRRWGREKVLTALLTVCGLLVPFVLSHVIAPMFVTRYIIPGMVGALLLIAGGVATIQRDSIRIVIMLGLILSSGVLVGTHFDTPTREDWEGANAYITSSVSTNDLIIYDPFWAQKSIEYYGVPKEYRNHRIFIGDKGLY